MRKIEERLNTISAHWEDMQKLERQEDKNIKP